MRKIAVLSFLLLFLFIGVANAVLYRTYINSGIDEITLTLFEYQVDRLPLQRGDTLEVWVSSPGGLVSSSIAIYDYLKRRKADGITIWTVGSGICASGATVVLQAGDIRAITVGTMFLVHKAFYPNLSWQSKIWLRLFGGTTLDYTNAQLYRIYAVRSKRPIQAVQEDLSYDHWMTAEEAVLKGYADIIII